MKKGLDLSRWREIVPSSRVSIVHNEKKSFNLTADVGSQKINGEAMVLSDEKTRDNRPSMAVSSNNDSPPVSASAAFVDAVTESISSAAMELNRINDLRSERNDNEKLSLTDNQNGNTKVNSNKLTGGAVGGNVTDGAQLQRLPYDNVDMGNGRFSSCDIAGVRGKNFVALIGQNSLGSVDENVSLESQIDAENRALLDRMSPEEITEAQAEIRNRINPALAKILKKRGLQKLEKQMNSGCGSGADALALGDMRSDIHVTKSQIKSFGQEGNIAPPTKPPSIQNAEKRPDEGDVQNLISNGGSSWNDWSRRVEAVRNIRFSLDGDVVEESSSGPTCSADSVAERDFLRTDGDPGAAGYTVKEALALTRSVVPGQRGLALHLLASVLSKALLNICKGQLGSTASVSNDDFIDWEAVWAYALGPEPELVLSLRMTLDDNHNSVVLASAKVIQCILACDINENFFNRLEKMALKSLYTAPVFRSRPDIQHGFLGGGFWKYSAKPSSILSFDMEIVNDQSGGERTIQDDNTVAGQDIVAGLVRMGILSRFRYLLETDPTLALEECILSILISIARHSPTCANAIWKCERLVQTIIDRFAGKDSLELQASKVKSVTLLRVLAQSSKSICIEFIKEGFFQIMTWQLHRVTSSIDEWVKSGREVCKLASELLIEQLRFWRVCIMYGCCISYFSSFFPALCLWLNPPTFDKLIEKDFFHEFSSISSEAYLVLETLAKRLPDLYSSDKSYHVESWNWNDVSPMVDMALNWIDVVTDASLSRFLCQENGEKSKFKCLNTCVSSLLWTLSSILCMLHIVLKKATPKDVLELKGFSDNRIRLPEFVTKIAGHISRNYILNVSDKTDSEHRGIASLIEKFCYFRHHSDPEVSVASIWCFHGLFRVIISIDYFIQLTRENRGQICFQGYELSGENKILDVSILKGSFAQWRTVLDELMKLLGSEWHFVNDIEVFGRGGPSPGVGVGWGASGGGLWSSTVTLVQADATLLIELLETFHSSPPIDVPGVDEHTFITQSINSALASSLIVGPGNKMVIQKVIDILLQIRVLKYLNQCISHFPHCNRQQDISKWEYTEADLMQFSKLLASHFTNRWLSVKKKKMKAKDRNRSEDNVVTKLGNSLDTIHEDVEPLGVASDDSNFLTVEWAHQCLPLPSHWLLSPISTTGDITSSDMSNSLSVLPPMRGPSEAIEVLKAGLFFLLGIEAISFKHLDEVVSVVRSIPLIWKLHTLSVALLIGISVLEEQKSRAMFEALQGLYGQHLDDLRFSSTRVVCKAQTFQGPDRCRSNCLMFQSEIHDSYSTFVETLVEQFAAVSYGDLIYGRQITIYLHREVEASVRLAAWNALSNARVLELLPSLGDCLSQAEGYLEPVEEDVRILEAYAKSWVSGSLDKAATRDSMAYTIALHHLSSFIFNKHGGERLLLRNKLVKSLLRHYSRKQLHQGMMLDLIKYNYSPAIEMPERSTAQFQMDYVDQRFELLQEACEGNSQLLSLVGKLRLPILKQFN